VSLDLYLFDFLFALSCHCKAMLKGEKTHPLLSASGAMFNPLPNSATDPNWSCLAFAKPEGLVPQNRVVELGLLRPASSTQASSRRRSLDIGIWNFPNLSMRKKANPTKSAFSSLLCGRLSVAGLLIFSSRSLFHRN